MIKYSFIPGLIIGAVGLIINSQKAMRGLNKQSDPIKKSLIKPIINFLIPDFRYWPDERISQEEIDESQLFQANIDLYNGDDLMEGSVNDVPFKLSETSLDIKTTKRDHNNHVVVTYPAIFSGLFVITELRDKRVGDLFILPNPEFDHPLQNRGAFEQLLSNKDASLLKNNLKWSPAKVGNQQALISFETGDQNFDHAFLLFAGDPASAKKTLNEDVRNQIYAMVEQNLGFVYPEAPLYISIRKNRLYIAKRFSQSFFNANMQKVLDDESEMMRHYNQLHEIDLLSQWITQLSKEMQR